MSAVWNSPQDYHALLRGCTHAWIVEKTYYPQFADSVQMPSLAFAAIAMTSDWRRWPGFVKIKIVGLLV
jgi:hypothetical protein